MITNDLREKIKKLAQQIRSVAEGLEMAYSYLPVNEFPGPPTTVVASLRRIADAAEKLSEGVDFHDTLKDWGGANVALRPGDREDTVERMEDTGE